MKNSNTEYSTSCFNTACLLRYYNVPLSSIKDNRGKKIWVFERTLDLDGILESYFKGNVTVNLHHFLEVQRFIKTSIYNF